MAQTLEFKISTGLKNIIGRELITDDYIAIFELVKNSYDADASNVSIIFENLVSPTLEKPSRILIIDDGSGMSYADILNKWLFVGFSEKKITESSDFRDKITKRKRVFAGAKGIGRFSADRLGSKLNIVTKTSAENHFHSLKIDWTKFESDQQKEFQSIEVLYSTLETAEAGPAKDRVQKHGTILEITSLNELWDRKKLLKLKRYLQRLINPSEDIHDQHFKIHLQAAEFADSDKGEEDYNRINGPIRNVVFEKINMKTTQIKCDIEEDRIITELRDKGRFVFKFDEKNVYSELHGVHVRVFFMNEDAKTAFTKAMGIRPMSFGSIFLYKNGFRVHPYGNEENDWLGLDRRKAQGYARFLGNREIIGRIEVYGHQPGFQEVSSRDGGVWDSEALHQLTEMFIDKVLKRLESYVVEAINWDTKKEDKMMTPEETKEQSLMLIQKLVGNVNDPEKRITFNNDLLDIFKERQIEKIPELINNVDSMTKYVPSASLRKYIKNQLSAVKLNTAELQKGRKQAEEALKAKERQALFLMKEVAPDIEALDNLHHTIKLATIAIADIVDEINEKVRKGHTLSDILPLIDEISLENKKARLLAEIATKANFDPKDDWIKEDLVFYIKQYVERVLRARKGQNLDYKFQGADVVFQKKFRITDLAVILDNILDNSRKAGAKSIIFNFEIKNKKLHVLIGDDGKGVPERFEKDLFNRGFTTTEGSGIGLHQIKSILGRMGGVIKFEGNNYRNFAKGACFEVIIE